MLLLVGVTLHSFTVVRAHELTLRCEVQPPDRVIVSVLFYDEEPAAGATIRVWDPRGELAATGISDGRGQYVFTARTAVAYSFEATIAGHMARRQLRPEQVAQLNPGAGSLTEAGAHRQAVSPSAVPSAPEHLRAPDHAHEHVSPPDQTGARSRRLAELLAGLAFILSIAAFVMVHSLRREFRAHLDHGPHFGG